MTKNVQHAPEPWVANRVNPNGDILIESGGPYNIIATVWKSHPSFESTAHLMKTAPELLKALESIVRIADLRDANVRRPEGLFELLRDAAGTARAAIAEATGRAA
jgi:hypothetical protein